MKLTRKIAATVIAISGLAVTASSASADWNRFWHNLHVGFHRNNAWPDPFNEVDAMEVVAPFEIMKANGWKMHNTIGHELFRESDGALLASGHNRVRWIATQAPKARRTVYVLRGRSSDETEARVASVRQTIANLNLQGSSPTVLVTAVEPVTSSGDWALKVNREWLEHLAAPQLPSTSASGQQGAAQQSGN